MIVYKLVTNTYNKGQSVQTAVHLSQEMLSQRLLTTSAHKKGQSIQTAVHPLQEMLFQHFLSNSPTGGSTN